jgi:TonB family protein
MERRFLCALAILSVVGVAAAAQTGSSLQRPARYLDGPLPMLPTEAVGGGQVFLEVAVTAAGHVDAVKPLRTTPPFTALVVNAVSRWNFEPAEREGLAVGSTVLVVALVRPPSLLVPTLGELPRDVAAPSGATPFPEVTVLPAYPPSADGNGVVLVQLRIDVDGRVASAAVVRSTPPFDEAALDAVRQWRFRPPVDGGGLPTVAYAILGFPVPVVGPGPLSPRPGGRP